MKEERYTFLPIRFLDVELQLIIDKIVENYCIC